MTLAAFTAAGVALFCAGFLTCLCINRNDARRIPEHPAIRGSRVQHTRLRPRLRVIEGGTSCFYDWAEDQ